MKTDDNEMMLSVRTALMEVVPLTVNVWKHCRDSSKKYACVSARQLLFHTFVSICADESYDALPDAAFVYVMHSSFSSWSEEFFMSLVCRHDRRFGRSTNLRKLKTLFICTIRHSFRRELASAKDTLRETSALSNLSVLVKDYYAEKMATAKTLGSMIRLHTFRGDVVVADIASRVFSDEDLALEPLEAYPDRSDTEECIDAAYVAECFGSFALPTGVSF